MRVMVHLHFRILLGASICVTVGMLHCGSDDANEEQAAKPAGMQMSAQPLAFPEAEGHITPRVPEHVRLYAIGDIHGRLDLLRSLQQQIDADRAAHPDRQHVEIYLGDYVDRGADSAGVLEMLIARQQSHGAICLSGNHEEMLLQGLEDKTSFEYWLRVGGYEAVLSYLDTVPASDDPTLWEQWRAALPASHLTFLRNLGLYDVRGDYLFVHAGLRPGVPLAQQKREDMLWIRRLFLDSPLPHGHFVVHGHQPVSEVEVRPNRMDIDTRAYDSGRLSCVVLEGPQRFMLST